MSNRISGPGIGLSLPVGMYPTALSLPNSIPPQTSGNRITLAPGQAQAIPSGENLVSHDGFCVVQMFDPVSKSWQLIAPNASHPGNPQFVRSDGFNARIANMLGCPIAAVVTTAGTNYVQSSTSVSVSAGNSTWYPVVGGLLTVTSITVAGSGYGKAPLVYIPPPPASLPGVSATAFAAISSGTVNTITVANQGAGYTSGFTLALLPDPTDPNLGSITIGTVVLGITGAGVITAVINTDPGAPVTATPTLTIAGAGASAAATAVWMNTITSTTITANGAGYAADNEIRTVGGRTAATPAFVNPIIELSAFIPRAASMLGAVAGTLGTVTSVSTVYDSGMFTGTPRAMVSGGATTTVGSITLGLGSKQSTALIQPI